MPEPDKSATKSPPGTHRADSPEDGKPFGKVDVNVPEEVAVRLTRPLWALVVVTAAGACGIAYACVLLREIEKWSHSSAATLSMREAPSDEPKEKR